MISSHQDAVLLFSFFSMLVVQALYLLYSCNNLSVLPSFRRAEQTPLPSLLLDEWPLCTAPVSTARAFHGMPSDTAQTSPVISSVLLWFSLAPFGL